MKVLASLLLVLSLTETLAGEVLDFEFLHATGSKYRTTTLSEDLSSDGYPADEYEHLSVLLVETPSLDNAQYVKQDSNLDSHGHDMESLQILLVVASQKGENPGGYHTSLRVAQALAGSRATFRVRLLDKRGLVLHESLEPISAETLRAWAGTPMP